MYRDLCPIKCGDSSDSFHMLIKPHLQSAESITWTWKRSHPALGLLPPGPHPVQQLKVNSLPSKGSPLATTHHGVTSSLHDWQVSRSACFTYRLLAPAYSRFQERETTILPALPIATNLLSMIFIYNVSFYRL